ncbi:MAG: biopolymer transporter ExbD [Thiotrichales bacterium]|jgi:biopolymer transport protein ExbD|nr:biopolymer transporter ExbD [Thiotrichales bacterium]MAX28849.1 biopolymer transporter ExbD [Thiotrichales bacterium]OUX52724.1 MAG: biopolymer transporter ExbD [Methylococcaceae bacterium TMED282]|tara:strand:- start:597 stop:1010 length:414 start_codon:yes stop_codon:yes gene_type:complete
MKRIKSIIDNEESESAIDVTPMLDVVFIMLIFFIVTATFVKEAGIDVSRSAAETAVAQNKAHILVAIDSKNSIWVDKREIDLRAVKPNIRRLISLNPHGTVLVQADKASYTDTLISVMDEIRAAGVTNIAISAMKPR